MSPGNSYPGRVVIAFLLTMLVAISLASPVQAQQREPEQQPDAWLAFYRSDKGSVDLRAGTFHREARSTFSLWYRLRVPPGAYPDVPTMVTLVEHIVANCATRQSMTLDAAGYDSASHLVANAEVFTTGRWQAPIPGTDGDLLLHGICDRSAARAELAVRP